MKKVTITMSVEGQGEEFDFTVATMKLLVKQFNQESEDSDNKYGIKQEVTITEEEV